MRAPKRVPWQNWAGTVAVTPVRVVRPTCTDSVAAIIREAADSGLAVKAVGAGHSFTDIAAAPGIQIDLSALRGIVDVDRSARLVTLRADTRLHQVPELLRPHGLAMENLGDIDAQSIAGAISTGTHGTGLRFGGIATQVRGLTLVDGSGNVQRIEGDDVAGHVIGLGALGVITEVTLQCVETFAIEDVQAAEPLTAVLDEWRERITGYDHFEFYWFPHTDVALTKSQHRLPGDAELRPMPRWRRRLDDHLVSNRLFELSCRMCHVLPAAVPQVNRVATRLTGRRAHVDLSTSVYTTTRDVRFTETEFAIPVYSLPAVVREIDDLVTRRDWRISFPIECRAAAADDVWMSTAYRRDTAYVAVHRYHRERHEDYFEACEEILREHGGRPHWGKMHGMTRRDLAASYPRFDDFLMLRDRLDPGRVFANAYLDRVLGR